MKNIIYVLLGLSLALNGYLIYQNFHFDIKQQLMLATPPSIIIVNKTEAVPDVSAFKSSFHTVIKGSYLPNNLINKIMTTPGNNFTGISIYYGLDGSSPNVFVEGATLDNIPIPAQNASSTQCYKLLYTYCPRACGSIGPMIPDN